MELLSNQEVQHSKNINFARIFCPEILGEQKTTPSHRKFRKGEMIYTPDDDADRIFYILEGQVKISNHDKTGKEVIKSILSKDEVFGLPSALINYRHDYAIAT